MFVKTQSGITVNMDLIVFYDVDYCQKEQIHALRFLPSTPELQESGAVTHPIVLAWTGTEKECLEKKESLDNLLGVCEI